MIGGHVSVDLLPHYLSPRGKKRLSLIGSQRLVELHDPMPGRESGILE